MVVVVVVVVGGGGGVVWNVHYKYSYIVLNLDLVLPILDSIAQAKP